MHHLMPYAIHEMKRHPRNGFVDKENLDLNEKQKYTTEEFSRYDNKNGNSHSIKKKEEIQVIIE